MKLQKLDLLNKTDIDFIGNLYIESFLEEERRPVDEMWKLYEESKAQFFILLAVSENKRVGFFTYWDLEDFIFAEHLAVSSNFRSGGYGSKIINLFKENIFLPIVLEVEPPETEIAKRRIGFYQRLGFEVWNVEYRQPSYHQDGKSYPMKLMSDNIDLSKNCKEIINKIHTVAYKV